VNERQRDLFLYIWTQRRKPGQTAIGLRGALIGALGGLVFALILMPDATSSGAQNNDIIAQIMSAAKLFGLSIPAFAFIGWLGANRVFAAQEAQYQAILQTGARIPDQKPVMQPADRWPAIMVGVFVLIIVGFIATLFVMYGDQM
jgi:hypothetical protein